LPALAISRENPGRLLMHRVLHTESASLAGCSSDPWDASRYILLPFAYPGGYPHELAPKTGEVSWSCMGLRHVIFLAEVRSHSSKSQGFPSGWSTVEFKNPRASPTVSGRAATQTRLARSYLAVASQRSALWNLNPSKYGPRRHSSTNCSGVSHRF
jgi:hypothetical protein